MRPASSRVLPTGKNHRTHDLFAVFAPPAKLESIDCSNLDCKASIGKPFLRLASPTLGSNVALFTFSKQFSIALRLSPVHVLDSAFAIDSQCILSSELIDLSYNTTILIRLQHLFVITLLLFVIFHDFFTFFRHSFCHLFICHNVIFVLE